MIVLLLLLIAGLLIVWMIGPGFVFAVIAAGVALIYVGGDHIESTVRNLAIFAVVMTVVAALLLKFLESMGWKR